jgi:hypothetical protein
MWMNDLNIYEILQMIIEYFLFLNDPMYLL